MIKYKIKSVRVKFIIAINYLSIVMRSKEFPSEKLKSTAKK